MTQYRRTKTAALALLMLSLAVGVAHAQASDLWFHVQVQEGDATSVNINLPLSLIEKALPMIPQDEIHLDDGGLHIDGVQWTLEDLRELWAEIRNSPDMTFISVDEVDESVRVSKSGEHMLVRVDERHGDGEQVNVKIPLAVVEALLAGSGEKLQIEVAFRALADHGEGELVTVESDSESVRVWIDGTSGTTS